MKKLFSTKEKIIVISLSAVILLSSVASVFTGIKLWGKKGTEPIVPLAPENVTLEDIKTPDKDYSNLDFSDKIKDGVLSVDDCGAEANSLYDWGPLIRSVFQTAAKNPGTTVEFSEGTYYVAPASKNDTYVFDLGEYEIDGMTVKGNGCKLVLMDNYLGCFNFRNSNKVSVENMQFDCLEDPFIQATVTAFDKELQILTVKTDEAYTVFDDDRMQDRFTTAYGMVRDKNNPYMLKKECNNFFFFTSYEKLSDTEFKIGLSSQTTYFTNNYIEVGDKITLNNRKGETTFIFDICEAGNFTANNITIYNSPGGGVVGRQNYGDIVLKNFRMMPDPKGNNWLCGNADGVHIQGSRGKVIMEDCFFSNLSDDAVNLYQWESSVTKVVSPTVIEVETRVSPVEIGDTIEVIDQSNGMFLGSAKVKELEAIEGKRIDQAARLIFETPVSGMKTGTGGTYIVYNKDKSFGGTVIKNCTFMNIRGRGLVLCTSDTTVEKCTFQNLSNHALNGWFIGDEGYALNNLTFKDNTVKNCHYLIPEVDNGRSGAIDITIKNAGYIQSEGISHDGITITGNSITDYHGCAIRIGNSRNVTISNNFFDLKEAKAVYKENNVLYFNRCEDVSISDNVFNDDSAGLSAAIRYENSSVKNIEIKDNTFACDAEQEVVKE